MIAQQYRSQSRRSNDFNLVEDQNHSKQTPGNVLKMTAAESTSKFQESSLTPAKRSSIAAFIIQYKSAHFCFFPQEKQKVEQDLKSSIILRIYISYKETLSASKTESDHRRRKVGGLREGDYSSFRVTSA